MASKKNPAAVALGRLGGKRKVAKGFAKLSKEQIEAVGRKGAAARWGSKKSRAKRASQKT